jgi:hypothetical protein
MNNLRHARHAIDWLAVGVSAVPGGALVAVSLVFHGDTWALGTLTPGLLLLAVPAAFVLDDPATPVAGATPRSPWWDLAGRSIAVAALSAAVVLVAWTWHLWEPLPQPWLLPLISVCLALVVVAGSAVMRRAGRPSPGDALAGALVFAVLGLALFRPSLRTWELLPAPGSAGPIEVGAWIAAAMCAIVVVVMATSGRGSRVAVDA